MTEFVFTQPFRAGVQLAARKSLSTALPIRRDLLPRELVVSLRQHRGAAAEPTVRAGDHVRRGQTIATPSALGPSAAVHASSSGVVSAIEERPTLVGNNVQPSLCVIIATDGRDEALEAGAAAVWPTDANARREALRTAGIVGLGGAVYPTADKLVTPVPCKALIVNGAECEPYISCDDMLMREQAREVVTGALILCDLLAAPRCIIAVEQDKPEALEALQNAATSPVDARLRLAEVPAIYPSGGERQLVELLTGEEVPSGRYPGEFGYVCQNVGTAFAVQRFAMAHEPLVSRIVTVTGGGVRTPQNVLVPLGTPIADLIAHCGGYAGDVARLIVGGSMMGVAIPDDSLPVTKATNCIIAATATEVRLDTHEWPCIRCGDCATACPARLLPQELLTAAETSDTAALDTLGLTDCIECGCCDVVCPSHIALTQRFRVAKRMRYEAS